MAEWVSGIGSLLAVIVALGGYWLSDRQRKREEEQRREDAAYQIGYKLSGLASEAQVIHQDLNPHGKTDEELASETDPMQICGTLQPKVGHNDTMAKDLSETEQNLLMRLKEEDFLMDFSEAFARNQSIRAGLLEYKMRREAITPLLPTPVIVNGEVVSFDLTKDQYLALQPHVIPAASLVKSMRELSKVNTEMLAGLCRKFHPMMKKHYPKLHIEGRVT